MSENLLIILRFALLSIKMSSLDVYTYIIIFSLCSILFFSTGPKTHLEVLGEMSLNKASKEGKNDEG